MAMTSELHIPVSCHLSVFFWRAFFKEMKHQFLSPRFEALHHLFGGCIPDRNGTRCLQIISKSIVKRRKIRANSAKNVGNFMHGFIGKAVS